MILKVESGNNTCVDCRVLYYTLGLMNDDIGGLTVARCNIATLNMTMAVRERTRIQEYAPVWGCA